MALWQTGHSFCIFPAAFSNQQTADRPQEGDPQLRGEIAKLRPGHARRRGKFGKFWMRAVRI